MRFIRGVGGVMAMGVTTILLSGCIQMDFTESVRSDGTAHVIQKIDASALEQMGQSMAGSGSTTSGGTVKTSSTHCTGSGGILEKPSELSNLVCEDIANGVVRVEGDENLTRSGALTLSGGYAYYNVSKNFMSSSTAKSQTKDAEKSANSKESDEMAKKMLQGMFHGTYTLVMPGKIVSYSSGTLVNPTTLKFELLDLFAQKDLMVVSLVGDVVPANPPTTLAPVAPPVTIAPVVPTATGSTNAVMTLSEKKQFLTSWKKMKLLERSKFVKKMNAAILAERKKNKKSKEWQRYYQIRQLLIENKVKL